MSLAIPFRLIAEREKNDVDFVSLLNYEMYLKLMIDGVVSRPFSARTLSSTN